MKNIVAVMSSAICVVDGNYTRKTLDASKPIPSILGVTHYIGHPTTKEIVENMGAAATTQGMLFEGLEVGETMMCFSIAPGKSTRGAIGHTTPHQETTIDDLVVVEVTRLRDDIDHCGNFYCGNRT